jgi:two-component system, chemotaxis family, sensor kinase CheA
MADSIDQLRESFVEETRDLINELEDILLSSEIESVSSEIIDQIFRSIHTIKGSGGMLGFDKVLAVTHDLEDIYDRVRSKELSFSSELKDISLETIDILKTLLSSNELLNSSDQVHFTDLCRKIHLFDVVVSEKSDDKKSEVITPEIIFHPVITYYIEFEPGKTLPDTLSHPIYLFKELALMGSYITYSKKGKDVELNNLDEADKFSAWKMILSTREDISTIEEVFNWVKTESTVLIKEIIVGDLLSIADSRKELEKLKDKIFKKTFLDIKGIAENYADEIADEIQEENRKKEKSADETQLANNVIKSIRVSTEKIDQLLNLVSEMVTLQARLNLIANISGDNELIAVAEKYGSFSKQLRDNAFTISLVPFGITITRYKRMVHDLSEQLGKKVDFITEGEDTVLDKKIIEQLSDPIMHILRNSVDHGIEPPEERLNAGKNEIGKITMKIFHQSNNVIIKIIDDGRGIDLEEIRKIGIRKKMIKKDQLIDNDELLALIFLPGFSSAKKISNISGRGVGLDVVKRNISEIRGTINVETEIGKYSVLTIKLPLTLSIIDGLQVKIDQRDFIIPLLQVSKIYTLDNFYKESKLNQFMVLEGIQVPYFDLREDFDIGGIPPERQEIVLVGFEKEKVALIVDSVIGENQTVLKSLGSHYKQQDFISGGTILGDGSVALVLDINKIVTEFSKIKNK